MECPVCKEPMIVLEYEAVEVDFCAECEGIWLDAGEIELLFEDHEDCAAFLSVGGPADSGGEKPRPCPACRAKMTKEATESAPPVLFDHCPNGHGLWFDKGELAQVLRHGSPLEKEGPVTVFLQDIFSQSTEDGADGET